MKLIIAGGRDYQFNSIDIQRLHGIYRTYGVTEVVSGGASGADTCGEKWALDLQIPVKRFPADWNKHGRAAGPLRNKDMAEYADAVALFPGGRGTDSMHREAVAAELIIWDYRTS